MKHLLVAVFSFITISLFSQSHFIKMPPVGMQGSEGSCVTWATLYAMDAEWYYKTGATSYSQSTNIFSPEFVYNQVKSSGDCLSGSSLIGNLSFLQRSGACTWASMPYSDQNGCSTLPNSAQVAEAANYKITNYYHILATDIPTIKSYIANNHPLIFTFTVDSNFQFQPAGYIWNSFSSTFYGPHACTITGYDDSKNAYKVIDENGPNWADSGYRWIDYNFFATLTYDVYTLTFDAPIVPPLVANVGTDLSYSVSGGGLASITIYGSASGGTTPYSYVWKDLSNNNLYPSQNIFVQKPVGIYKFELTVSDAGGLTDKDTMQVTVNSTTIYQTSVSLTQKKSRGSNVLSWTISTNDRLISATLYRNGSPVKTSSLLTDTYPASSGTWQVIATCQRSSAQSNIVNISSGRKVAVVFYLNGTKITGQYQQ